MATPRSLVWADRQLGLLAGLLAWIGAAGIVALMVVTAVAVFWRYALNNPIYGIEDLSIIALTLVAGGAVAYGGRRGAHVSVDIISMTAKPGLLRVTGAVMRVLSLAILGLATWALYDKACGIEKACVTSNFSVEHRPFYYFLGVCIGVYALQTLVDLLSGIFGPDDPSETLP